MNFKPILKRIGSVALGTFIGVPQTPDGAIKPPQTLEEAIWMLVSAIVALILLELDPPRRSSE